ncbi:hypothetical protein BTI57_04805 [Lactobacillus delbrueckii subsp. bulgaricus]|nr:hypothetical protein [Lactobacillus delbrueckii subsp. bulgaricus]
MSSKISKKVYAAILATGLMSFSGVLVETAMNVTFPILMKQFGLVADSNRHPARLYFPGRNRSLPLAHVLQERENRRWI